jgi:mRNA-degrading endonuclease RelE of RelBE toxin-antitoxin system
MSDPKVIVNLSARFLKDLRRLEKKYRRVRQDVKPLIAELESGTTPGDQLQRVGRTVYKVRIANSDAQRGKSGGYRVLYYLRTTTSVYLIAIYSKTEFEDISDDSIAMAIEDLLSKLEADSSESGE